VYRSIIKEGLLCAKDQESFYKNWVTKSNGFWFVMGTAGKNRGERSMGELN